MSIFGSIRDAIFGASAAASPANPRPQGGAAGAASGAPLSPGGMSKVDVSAMLDKLDRENPENLDWRRSIVDLMKLLKLDSSLKARKELAAELGYDGSMSDSAKMNIWLHKQVMTKLAEHGGDVPDELRQ